MEILKTIGREVISEKFDNEVVLLNLTSGKYYSIMGSGPAIWAWLEQGATLSQIKKQLLDYYDVSGEQLDAPVSDFIKVLQAEGLVIAEQVDTLPEIDALAEGKQIYKKPKIEVHTDMQEFLLVDPIHEVNLHDLTKTSP